MRSSRASRVSITHSILHVDEEEPSIQLNRHDVLPRHSYDTKHHNLKQPSNPGSQVLSLSRHTPHARCALSPKRRLFHSTWVHTHTDALVPKPAKLNVLALESSSQKVTVVCPGEPVSFFLLFSSFITNLIYLGIVFTTRCKIWLRLDTAPAGVARLVRPELGPPFRDGIHIHPSKNARHRSKENPT